MSLLLRGSRGELEPIPADWERGRVHSRHSITGTSSSNRNLLAWVRGGQSILTPSTGQQRSSFPSKHMENAHSKPGGILPTSTGAMNKTSRPVRRGTVARGSAVQMENQGAPHQEKCAKSQLFDGKICGVQIVGDWSWRWAPRANLRSSRLPRTPESRPSMRPSVLMESGGVTRPHNRAALPDKASGEIEASAESLPHKGYSPASCSWFWAAVQP
ncbi:unnamed protein product [Pleuronectes platessa]|uniref:Uncharacterized protein n=1 Tax=Pleuronectes platessa TaxID=8262 RepID=A0A9N7V1L7_PLEPL|nr:unnamed protein product [Pleuronectes platessa]